MAANSRIDIRNEAEAQVLESLLDDEDIPHYVRSFHDSAYDGLFQTELGWGYVETPKEREAEVRRLLEGIRGETGES